MAKRLLLVISVMALVLGIFGAVPANAATPDRTTQTVFGYSEPNTVCGFPMDHVSDLVVTDWVFYDESGNVREFRQTIRVVRATFTNTLTGKSVTMTGGMYHSTYYPGDDFSTITGRIAVVNAPGVGLIFQDAGRIQVSGPEPPYEFLFLAGHHDMFLALVTLPWVVGGPES